MTEDRAMQPGASVADLADNSVSPGSGDQAQESLDASTAREEAQVEANQKRYDLRSSGKSSAEVNEMEAKAKSK